MTVLHMHVFTCCVLKHVICKLYVRLYVHTYVLYGLYPLVKFMYVHVYVLYQFCRRMKVLIGFSYVALKVGLILSVEAGIFPLLCGWWMDICSFVSSARCAVFCDCVHMYVCTYVTYCTYIRTLCYVCLLR